MSKRQQLLKSRKRGIILIIIGAFLVPIGSALFAVGWNARQNAIMALNGELIPFNVDYSKPFDMMLSTGVDFQYNTTGLAKGVDLSELLSFANVVPDQLQIHFDNGKMLVSAYIRDSNNTLIAQIVDNEWKTRNPDTLLFWDRNYNAYAFEIIDSDNVPTLQVIMIGPNKIQLGGLFYTKTGSIYIAPEPNGDAMMYVNVDDQHRQDEANITRIFKYPALTDASNLGKMVNPFYPSSDPLLQPNAILVASVIVIAVGSIAIGFGFEKRKTANDEIIRMEEQAQSRQNARTDAWKKRRMNTGKRRRS